MPSNHFILCHPLLLLPLIFPSIRVFSNDSALCIRWPKYWSFSFNIIPTNEHPGLISFRMNWLDLLASARDSQKSYPIPQFKSINSLVLSFLYSPTDRKSTRLNSSHITSSSALPVNIQDWFLLALTGLISLQSKGRSRVFSNTTVQKHQFFGAQLSLQSNSHIHT